MDQQHLTYAAVAERLGVKVGTVYAWVSRKQIPHIRLGKRVVRFPADAIDEWLEAGFVAAVGAPNADE